MRQVRGITSEARKGRKDMTLKRMDNILIVIDDLEAAKAFFFELGMELEGETTVEGPSVDRLIGLQKSVLPSRRCGPRTVTDGSSWTSSTRRKRSELGLITFR